MFDIEEELSWADEEYIPEINRNCYISDSGKAAELIAQLTCGNLYDTNVRKIQHEVTKMFKLIEEEDIGGMLPYHKRFMTLVGRLKEHDKLRRIGNKTVIGVGGRFSAGKSKFINTVSGLSGILPEDQNPTTSIPTYIVCGHSQHFTAYTNNGESRVLTAEQVGAMTHEFYETYKIGFSAFVESIIVSSENWHLSQNIAFLDTPGYSKHDNSNVKDSTDLVKAREQLKINDYLIWLVGVDGGVLDINDIEFIRGLNIETPILIVFNKCEKKTSDQIGEILDGAVKTVKDNGIACWGIVGYSAFEQKEYGGRVILGNTDANSGHLIQDFIRYTENSGVRKNDILSSVKELERDIISALNEKRTVEQDMCAEIEKYIKNSENVMEIRSMSAVWSDSRRKRYDLKLMAEEVQTSMDKINGMIKQLLKGDNNDE